MSTSEGPRLDLGRLPIAGPLLIGRETELARLDAAWESSETHVLTFVAFGGMGKSALVSHWMDRMAVAGWRGARRVLEWSFYRQGTEDRGASAEPFLDHALTWFGEPAFKAAPRDRGLRLAELVRREKTLLVLDGTQPEWAAAFAEDPKGDKRGALAIWKEKLDFLLEQEPLAEGATQKFALRKQIEEARKKIQELGG